MFALQSETYFQFCAVAVCFISGYPVCVCVWSFESRSHVYMCRHFHELIPPQRCGKIDLNNVMVRWKRPRGDLPSWLTVAMSTVAESYGRMSRADGTVRTLAALVYRIFWLHLRTVGRAGCSQFMMHSVSWRNPQFTCQFTFQHSSIATTSGYWLRN